MTDASPPVRTALIGYGFAGRTFHAALIGSVPGLQLALVASSNQARVHADLPGVRVLGDPLAAATDPAVDLVVIASPNDSHASLATAALEAGKHVVVDKPFTLSLSQARELAALAARHERLLSVFQNRRWDSDFLGIQKAIADDLVGEAVHLESRIERFRPRVRDRWREQAVAGSGLWWDLGPHLVDQALVLFGIPDSVQASMAVQREGGVVDDWVHVVLGFGARRAVLHASLLSAGGSPRFVLHGQRGTVVKRGADRQESQLIEGLVPGVAGFGDDPDPMLVTTGESAPYPLASPRGDQSRYYLAIRDALRSEGMNPVSPGQAIAVIAVMEAAITSHQGGCRVPLDLTQEERRAFHQA